MVELGRVGLWTRELRDARRSERERLDAVRELEQLGYGAIWMLGGTSGSEFFDMTESYLSETSRIAVASGILSIWTNPPGDVAAATAGVTARFPGRFLLGLGVSHAHLVENTGQRYEKPLTKMRDYLDELERTQRPPVREEMCLAALGPKMLELSAERTCGAHPYFVPVEHTRQARETLGPGPLLAPEQAVVVETDPTRAREIARRHMRYYLAAPNYTNNLRRLGFTDEDFEGGGSERLVDALVAWGSPEAIQRRVQEHLDAGADHVCLQVLPAEQGRMPLDDWRSLAYALGELLRL